MGRFGLYRDNNGTSLVLAIILTFDDVLGYLDDLEIQVVQCLVESCEPDPLVFIFVCVARSASLLALPSPYFLALTDSWR